MVIFINLDFLDIGVTSFFDIHEWALKNLKVNPVKYLIKRIKIYIKEVYQDFKISLN